MSGLRFGACALLSLAFAGTPGDDPTDQSSVVTLFANDELTSTFSFETGDYATKIVDGQGVIDSAQIAFNVFASDQLSVGFVREVGVRVVDVDVVEEPAPTYSLATDLSPRIALSKFDTLFIQKSTLYYRAPIGKTIPIRGEHVESVFYTLPPDRTSSFAPKEGHTYVMRWAPQRSQRSDEKFVKFRVIDHEPGRSVTLRWARLTPLK